MNDWNGFLTGMVGGMEESRRRAEQQELDAKAEKLRQQIPLADPNARLGLNALAMEVTRKRLAAMDPVRVKGSDFLSGMVNAMGSVARDDMDLWP